MAQKHDDKERENFGETISQVITNGFLSVALAIGHKSGLFSTLASFNEPKTCDEICAAGGWKKSYVKEWLGAVVSGGIIDTDANGDKFFLPPHRHAALTQRTAGSDNFACHAFGMVMMSKSFEDILKRMKTDGDAEDDKPKRQKQHHEHSGHDHGHGDHEHGHGGHGHGHGGHDHGHGGHGHGGHDHGHGGHGHGHGGHDHGHGGHNHGHGGHGHGGHDHGHGAHDHGHGGHEHGHGHGDGDSTFSNMVQWYSESSDDFNNSHLLPDIIPGNPGLKELLEKGGAVLEIGCGPGASTMAIAKAYPNASIVGIEVDEDALKDARANLEKAPLKNVSFQVASVNELPSDWTARYDHVFAIDVMHHTIPSKALREIRRALKTGGTFTMVEFDSRATLAEQSKLKQAVWLYMHGLALIVPMSEEEGGDHHPSGMEHSGGEEGDKIEGFLWSKESIEKALKKAGWEDYTMSKIPGCLQQGMYVCRK